MDIQTDSMIRLLIVEKSLHDVEQIVSLLRSAGLHVKAEFAKDSKNMYQILNSKPLDLVLFSIDLADFSIKQAQHLIQKSNKPLSLIAMTRATIDKNIIESMNEGAQDLVNPDKREHFVHVFRREILNLTIRRKTMGFEKKLHESENRYQLFLANSKDAVAYVHEGMHIYANYAYLELFGFANFAFIEGMSIMDLAHSNNKNELKKMLRQVAKQKNKEHFLKIHLQHNSGEYIQGRIEFSNASYDAEPCTQILIRSQADTAKLEEQINYLHQHDLVTGLYNRQYFMQQLKKVIDAAVTGGTECAILYISIDHFSNIRDALGASGCDILLADLATILKKTVSKKHIMAHFGSNSFVSICYSKDKSFVEKLARSLPTLIERNISEVDDKSISITSSVGICYVDKNTPTNPNEIIARCEKTIVQIRDDGGNAIKVYEPSADEMTQDEEDGQINTMIKMAIKSKTISPLYQAIVSIGGGSAAFYSTLLELKDDKGRTHQQQNLILSAERTGIAKRLDRWIIMNAIKQIAITEQSKNNNKLRLMIPLSQDSLLDAKFVRWIAKCLNTARISGDSLVFMVNEADAVKQLKASKTLFKGLKQLHCLFALDKFGMGINPFQLIKHIKADIIRINPEYMDNLSTNNDHQDSIRKLTDMASSLNIKVIVPSVNDASILSVLWGLGVDFVQGDFLQAISSELNYDFSSMAD